MSKEVKIGIDVTRANREYRGIPIYTRSILREFGQVDPEKVKFVLTKYRDDKNTSNYGIKNADIERVPFNGRYVPWLRILQEQVVYPFFQKGIDLDVFWHPQNHGQYLTPVGYVCTLHDVLPLSKPTLSQDLDSLDTVALYQSRIKSARHATKIITVSHFSKDEICHYVGVPQNRVVVVHNGIDHSVFHDGISRETMNKVRAKYHLPQRYLLTVGSYAPHKNLSTLVEAFSRSHLVDQNYGLVMVGPKDDSVYTSDAQKLERLVGELGLSNQVLMLPAVPIDDLVGIYNGASIFAISSLCEGFGFPPLEAMACGVPVIASNTTSLPEICGNSVLYADPKDSQTFTDQINLLAKDDFLRSKLVTQAKNHVRQFTWEKTAQQTLDVLIESSK